MVQRICSKEKESSDDGNRDLRLIAFLKQIVVFLLVRQTVKCRLVRIGKVNGVSVEVYAEYILEIEDLLIKLLLESEIETNQKWQLGFGSMQLGFWGKGRGWNSLKEW